MKVLEIQIPVVNSSSLLLIRKEPYDGVWSGGSLSVGFQFGSM